MINYLDIIISGEKDDVFSFREKIRGFCKLQDLGEVFEHPVNYEGEILKIGKFNKTIFHERNMTTDKSGQYSFAADIKEFYYFKIQTFTGKVNFDFWETVAGPELSCYFKLKDVLDEVFVNTDKSRQFLDARYSLYLSDETKVLSNRALEIEKDFPSLEAVIKYLNRLSSKKVITSITQMEKIKNEVGNEDLFYFKLFPYKTSFAA